MNARYTQWLKMTALSLWAGVVLWHFFKGFPLFNLLEILHNGFVLLFLMMFFTALGRSMSRLFHISFESFSEEVITSFGIGTGLITFVLIGLAALGILYNVLIFCVILVAAGVVYSDIKFLCLRGYEHLHTLRETRCNLLTQFFIGLLLLATCITFFASATPPFFFDALTYHLAVPQQYLRHHGFLYIPHHHYSNYPANIGMVFLVGLSFSGGMLAHLMSWMFAPMTAFAVYAFTTTRWGRSTAVTAALILLFVPGILIASILTSVDNGVMFYSFLSCAALLSWFSSRQPHWFVLSGIFCGLAVGSKYTALAVTFITLELLIVLHDYVGEKRKFWAVLQKMVLFGLIVLIIFSPWLLKNVFYTGNPLFPFFNSIFEVQEHESLGYSQIVSRRIPGVKNWLERVFSYYLAVPWTASMNIRGAAGIAGILFLLGLPLLFTLQKRDGAIWHLAIASACAFGVWTVFLPRVLRYVFPIFPLLSLVIAYTLWRISDSRTVKFLIFSGLSVLVVYHFGLFLRETSLLRSMTYLFPHQTEREFLLDHGLNSYPAIEFINTETPLDSKVLFVGEMRGFYCQRDYELQVVRGDEDIWLQQRILNADTIIDVLQDLRHKKFTHLLFNRPEMQRIATSFLKRESFFHFQDRRKEQMLQELLSPQYARLVFSAYRVNVYEILYPKTL